MSVVARKYATEVAIGLSEGLFTVRIGMMGYGRVIRVTPLGAQALWILKGMNK